MPTRSRTRTTSAVLVALAVALVTSLAAPAGAVDGDVEAQRDETRRRKDALAVDLDVLNASEAELEAALSAVAVDIAGQQVQVQRAQDAVTLAETAVSAAEAELVATRTEIDDLRARLVERAVDSFISPAATTFYVVVESSGPAEAGRKQALLDGLSAADVLMVDQLEVAEQDLVRNEAAAQSLRTEADARRGEADGRLAELEQARTDQADLKAAVDARQADVLAEIETLAGAEVELNALIEVRRREEAERAAAERRAIVAAGRCIWPTAGSTTSEFGNRWGRLHAGIDIAAPTGTPIWAALPGTVVVAGRQGGYGNIVVVDHGGGKTTVYAHQSRIAASQGQQIDQGDVIGYVGSTGRSTGPHLHFETRQDDSPQNPRTCLG